MKCYLSGKISGLEKREYEMNFEKAEHDLYYKYYELFEDFSDIVNPLDIKPLFGIKRWLFFMAADLWELRKCTHIAMQPNWIESKGAVIEYFYAKYILKLKVIFL